MECNCYNNNNGASDAFEVRCVYGNVLRLAIPLTLRTVEKVGENIEYTDTDFTPSSNYPVSVELSKASVKLTLDVEMVGNIAIITDKGTIPIGEYAITVLCSDDNGNPYRFKQRSILKVVDVTADAGIEKAIEYEVGTWYLDPAIYLVMHGEDGVGIESITTESSEEVGGMNTITITMTNGQTKTFTVMNGSGTVDNELDINSPHPISNKTVTRNLNELTENVAGLFGDADYNKDNEVVRFYDKQKEHIIATVSGFPFVKNAYISNNTLVITFSDGSGRSAIGVPMSSVFDSRNYYNKQQVDNRIAAALENISLVNYYTKQQNDNLLAGKANLNQTTGKLSDSQATRVVLDYIVGVGTEDEHEAVAGMMWYESGLIMCSKAEGYNIIDVAVGPPSKDILYCNAEDNNTYRWTGSAWQQVGGGSSDNGYNVSYSNGVLTFSGETQPTYNNGILTL